jgi:hypothetical protein
MVLVAGDFRYVAVGYRKVAKLLEEPHEESLASILTLIEQSQSLSLQPLFLRESGEP